MVAWLVAIVIAVSAPFPKNFERVDPAALATSIDAAVEHADPLPGLTREQTALVMLAVAFKESSWSAAVDDHRVRGPAGECGLWQVMPVGRVCAHTRDDEARIALERMRRSFRACRALPGDERLAVYTSGSCSRGRAASRARLSLARDWWSRYHPADAHAH